MLQYLHNDTDVIINQTHLIFCSTQGHRTTPLHYGNDVTQRSSATTTTHLASWKEKSSNTFHLNHKLQAVKKLWRLNQSSSIKLDLQCGSELVPCASLSVQLSNNEVTCRSRWLLDQDQMLTWPPAWHFEFSKKKKHKALCHLSDVRHNGFTFQSTLSTNQRCCYWFCYDGKTKGWWKWKSFKFTLQRHDQTSNVCRLHSVKKFCVRPSAVHSGARIDALGIGSMDICESIHRSAVCLLLWVPQINAVFTVQCSIQGWNIFVFTVSQTQLELHLHINNQAGRHLKFNNYSICLFLTTIWFHLPRSASLLFWRSRHRSRYYPEFTVW